MPDTEGVIRELRERRFSAEYRWTWKDADTFASLLADALAALRERSKEAHIERKHPFGTGLLRDWKDCDREPCVTDLALLARAEELFPKEERHER